ncbi:MAG: FlgO family outer membrane protein [Phycisphaerae bacterium]|nr:FlgO family outer membrane protein [Phycisphaerae bacterium]MDD5380872.1 FlgO family outer membrane protein [Phycisphaerae bacterium]
MTKYIMKSALLALLCLIVSGCGETAKTPKSAIDISESKYDSYELRKARDQAKMEQLKNLTEREKAEHEILLTAVQNNIRLVDANDDVVTSANYKAAEYLIGKLPKDMPKDTPLLVASLVNVDNLSESSTFGRMVSEQISSRFKQLGYTTIELKMRTTIFIKEGSGEFMLSRELSDIVTKHRAQAVVVGTYAIASDRVYLTVRIVNAEDSAILASYDYNVPMTRDVFKMLFKGREGVNWL